MPSLIHSVALVGTEARLVQVEVDVGGGLPRFCVVGLPTKSVREAEQRTRSAIESSNQAWPQQRIVANLAPGSLPKEGTHFDLPIALGIVAGTGRVDPLALRDWVAVGELALDGSLRPVRGTLAAAMACRAARLRGLLCPAGNAAEASLVDGIEVVPARGLPDCIGFLRGEWRPDPVVASPDAPAAPAEDLREVRGQAVAKRALEVAAAGGHNLMLTGPPGSGKTMVARRLVGILPEMSMEESLEVTRIYSVAGLLADGGLIRRRPWRAPHHHVSVAGLVGGGTGLARPGEASLAHHGVLFMDELALFRRDALETLRAPLEEGVVRIARSGGAIRYPCRFSLIAAMNPCPCGYLGDWRRTCSCSDRALQIYRSKLSGPLMDRFDLHVTMGRLRRDELLQAPAGETSEVVGGRVAAARSRQVSRFGPGTTNAAASKAQLERAVELSEPARRSLGSAVDVLGLSGRGLDRVLRVARTIADLAGAAKVADDHVAEALTYRAHDGAEDAVA